LFNQQLKGVVVTKKVSNKLKQYAHDMLQIVQSNVF